MLTPEVRSTLRCALEPRHEDAHASEIGISDDGVCDTDMWMFWRSGVPGTREIRQPGTSHWGLGELGTNPCVLFLSHGGKARCAGHGIR